MEGGGVSAMGGESVAAACFAGRGRHLGAVRHARGGGEAVSGVNCYDYGIDSDLISGRMF